MSKTWSEREKKLIRSGLLTAGRKLFEKYGLTKTTVDEIAAAAKISKGAFYLFYRSKEELYFEICQSVENEFRQTAFESLVHPGPDKQESFRIFLRRAIEMMLSKPILRQLNGAEFEYLVRKLPPDIIGNHVLHDAEKNAKYFEAWMVRGWMKMVDLNALQSLLLSLFYFVLHREDFHVADFEASKELMIDVIATYLVPQKRGF